MINKDLLISKASSKGLSLTSLEREAGIGNGTIGKWFNEGSNPNLETIQKITEILGCTIDDLVVKKEEV